MPATSLSDDERMLLTVLAQAEKPIGLYEVMQQLMPPRPDGPGQWGQPWWGRQWCATARNWIDLRVAGMFEPAMRNGQYVGGYVVTDVGRKALDSLAGHE